MRSILIILAFFSMDLMGQHVLEQQHWPDGTLRSTRIADGDRIHFITYHENGRISEMGAYHKGRYDGTWKRYTDSGALILYARFDKGQREGTWEFRTDADQPLGRLRFQNGELAEGEQFNAFGELVAYREY